MPEAFAMAFAASVRSVVNFAAAPYARKRLVELVCAGSGDGLSA